MHLEQKRGPACVDVLETSELNLSLGGSKTWGLGTLCQCGSFPGTPLNLWGSRSHPTLNAKKRTQNLGTPLSLERGRKSKQKLVPNPVSLGQTVSPFWPSVAVWQKDQAQMKSVPRGVHTIKEGTVYLALGICCPHPAPSFSGGVKRPKSALRVREVMFRKVVGHLKRVPRVVLGSLSTCKQGELEN